MLARIITDKTRCTRSIFDMECDSTGGLSTLIKPVEHIDMKGGNGNRVRKWELEVQDHALSARTKHEQGQPLVKSCIDEKTLSRRT